MVAAVLLLVFGFLYIRSAEGAIVQGHEVGPAGECEHPTGAVCPYQQLNSLVVPKYVGLGIVVAFFVFGVWLAMQKRPEERALLSARKAAVKLGGDEGRLFDLVLAGNGSVYQHELVEKLQLSKVSVTRLLDRLESQGLVERRRRGMANLVVLKPEGGFASADARESRTEPSG